MKLFEEIKLGNITLSNRIVMAPMTRSRAINNIPNDLMATYYKQRSSAGLIITEGVAPSPNGLGPEAHRCYAGVLFHALSNQVAETHRQADLVIGVGYDPVEFNYEDWIPDAPVVHIDTTPADLDTRCHRLECDVVGSLRPALERLAGLVPQENNWDLDAHKAKRFPVSILL